MFSRLAFFLEKRGYRGRLLGNRELQGKHGWNAHDYGPDGLAAFFTAAALTPVSLTLEELSLRRIALAQAVIVAEGARFTPGHGAVLSVSRSSDTVQRRLLLAHESFHGIFFASEPYRSFCMSLWTDLPEHRRAFFRALLDALGYDSSDGFLAVNEFQAYLMQQPLDAAEDYFRRVAVLVDPHVTSADDPPALAEAASDLSRFTLTHFGIEAGGPLFLSRAARAAKGPA